MDWLAVCLLALGTLLTVILFAALAARRSLRIKLAVIATMYFLYSGFGIAASPLLVSNYTVAYFLFFWSLCVGVLAGGGLKSASPQDRYFGLTEVAAMGVEQPDRPLAWWSNRLATAFAGAYLFAIAGQLLLAGDVTSLLRPIELLTGTNQGIAIFQGRMERAENSLYMMLGYVKLLSTPFFYIELQRRFDKRWLIQFLVLFGITYLQVAAAEHWGRAALVQPFLVWLFILLLHGRITGRRFVLIVGIGFVVILPVLNAIADWRTGGAFASAGGFMSNLSEFRSQELSYPRHYPVAEQMGQGGVYVAGYLEWLLTLPIPGSVTGSSFSVTRDFSERILGIGYGRGGFYILLPGWLGESFIAFGAYYMLWGLIVGVIIGLLDRFLSQSYHLKAFDAFVLATLAIYLRSVTQEFLAQTIGSLWILFGLWLLHRFGLYRKRETIDA